MIEFFKKLFGAKSAEVKAPYKVEAPVAEAKVEAPKAEAAPKAKKPTVKKATTRKPKAPKA